MALWGGSGSLIRPDPTPIWRGAPLPSARLLSPPGEGARCWPPLAPIRKKAAQHRNHSGDVSLYVEPRRAKSPSRMSRFSDTRSFQFANREPSSRHTAFHDRRARRVRRSHAGERQEKYESAPQSALGPALAERAPLGDCHRANLRPRQCRGVWGPRGNVRASPAERDVRCPIALRPAQAAAPARADTSAQVYEQASPSLGARSRALLELTREEPLSASCCRIGSFAGPSVTRECARMRSRI